MNNAPLVSIIIPVYKGADYLAQAIESALSQTYKNIEVIVVNDGSPDNGATEQVALSYGNKIVYVKKENGGVSTALNLGISRMKGDYFSWLSHDDIYEKTKIERQVNALQSETDIVLCSGYLMDEGGRRIAHKTKMIKGRYDGASLFSHFIKGYELNGLGFLIPKSAFAHVGTFDENMRYLQDLDMWLRLMTSDKYTFVCQEMKLVVSRIHKNQTTNLMSERFDIDRLNLAKKHINDLINKHEKAYVCKFLILYLKLFVKGNNRTGLKLVVDELGKNGVSSFKIAQESLPYYVSGRLHSIGRSIYHFFFKLAGLRD